MWTETRRSCGTRRRRKREVVVVVDDDDDVDDIPQGHKLFHLTHTHNPPKALLIVLNREFRTSVRSFRVIEIGSASVIRLATAGPTPIIIIH